MKRRFRAVLVLAAALSAGCGGGGGSTGTSPSPVTPGQSALSVSVSSLSMNALGVQQQVTASEANYGGALSISLGACSSIVSVSPSSAQGPQATFTFSATAPGSCTFSVTDTAGQKQNIPVVVTTTSGTLQ